MAPQKGKSERPRLWIIAGPNGSGKSSAYENTEIEEFGGTVWIINPDVLTSRIADIEKVGNPNLEAVQRIERWLEASTRVLTRRSGLKQFSQRINTGGSSSKRSV